MSDERKKRYMIMRRKRNCRFGMEICQDLLLHERMLREGSYTAFDVMALERATCRVRNKAKNEEMKTQLGLDDTRAAEIAQRLSVVEHKRLRLAASGWAFFLVRLFNGITGHGTTA